MYMDCLENGSGLERGSARRSALNELERVIVNQSNTGTISKATAMKNLFRAELVCIIMGFPVQVNSILGRSVQATLTSLHHFI